MTSKISKALALKLESLKSQGPESPLGAIR
jgi:hypothetical protein